MIELTALIRSDSFAIQFQSLAQYRSALLKFAREQDETIRCKCKKCNENKHRTNI